MLLRILGLNYSFLLFSMGRITIYIKFYKETTMDSFQNTKLIFENWKKFIIEKDNPTIGGLEAAKKRSASRRPAVHAQKLVKDVAAARQVNEWVDCETVGEFFQMCVKKCILKDDDLKLVAKEALRKIGTEKAKGVEKISKNVRQAGLGLALDASLIPALKVLLPVATVSTMGWGIGIFTAIAITMVKSSVGDKIENVFKKAIENLKTGGMMKQFMEMPDSDSPVHKFVDISDSYQRLTRAIAGSPETFSPQEKAAFANFWDKFMEIIKQIDFSMDKKLVDIAKEVNMNEEFLKLVQTGLEIDTKQTDLHMVQQKSPETST